MTAIEPRRPEMVTVAELTETILERAHWSPLSQRRYLLLDLRDGPMLDAALQAFLSELPCPVIGIASDASHSFAYCDVVVETPQAAAPLVANVEHAPIAAMVLVEVLRAIERLPLESALCVESLAYATLQAGPEFRRWRERTPPLSLPAPEPGAAVLLKRQYDTLCLELNRPGNRNAMSVEMRDALCEALQLAATDSTIARVTISGRGRCFSTGGDVAEFGTAPDAATAHAVRSVTLPGRMLAQCAARVTAVVHGACIGSGIEFPAFAGRLVASADAFFQLPELQYGLIPGAGGCVSVSRRIGRQRTAWLALSGRRINARMARAWGLVDDLAQ